jgi:hypothetical protein
MTMEGTSAIWSYRNAVRTAVWSGLPLPRAIASVAKARFRYGLGALFHSIFELYRMPESAWPEYIGSNELNERHRPFSELTAKQLVNDKIAFWAHCERLGVPTAPILCVIDRRAGTARFGVVNGLDPMGGFRASAHLPQADQWRSWHWRVSRSQGGRVLALRPPGR